MYGSNTRRQTTILYTIYWPNKPEHPKSNLQPKPIFDLTMNALKCQSVEPKYSTNEPLASPLSGSISNLFTFFYIRYDYISNQPETQVQ